MRTGTKTRVIPTPLLWVGASEALALLSSMYVSAWILYGDLGVFERVEGPLLPRAAAITTILFMCMVSMGLYQFHRRLFIREAAARLIVGFGIGGLLLAALYYMFPELALGRRITLAALCGSFVVILAIRCWFLKTNSNLFNYRTLIYGAGQRAQSIAELNGKHNRRGFTIVGSVPGPGDETCGTSNGPLYEGEDLLELATRLNADEIVVAVDERRGGGLPIRDLLACKLRGIEVIDLMEFLEWESGKIRVDLVRPGWLLFSSGFRVSRLRRIVQRVFDVLLSVMVLALVWPIMLLVAIAIKLEDGPLADVFYRQERVGFHGERFKVLKFRSMHENAEAAGEEVWAVENDDRVTRVGKVLRKYRLDELPQVLNVLRGSMSFVGPRPERPNFVAQLSESIPYYVERHTVKPGITGWAQLKYAYGATEQDAVEKLQYDLFYVKNKVCSSIWRSFCKRSRWFCGARELASPVCLNIEFC